MNKHKIIVYFLFVFAFCFSCSEGRVQKQNNVIVDLTKGVKDSIGYSLFVDSIEHINLETTDSCLIGKITDMAISRSDIFLFDGQQQTVWRFGRDGKYLNKISGKGEGPGEYGYISQFEYDDRKNQIAVLSSGQKAILFYTPEGKYLKTVKLEMRPDDFKICPQGGFILSNSGLDEPEAGIYHVDESGQGMVCLVKRDGNHLVYITSEWELCSYEDIICFMAPNFDNVVYNFENQELSVEYPFRMKPNLKHNYKKTVSLQHLEDFIRTTYLEGKRWIWATYWSSVDDLRIFVYSKDTGEYWIGRGMVNDSDDSGIGRKTSVTQDNTFVTWQENENPNENPPIQILHLK
jgi:hypothetical protein